MDHSVPSLSRAIRIMNAIAEGGATSSLGLSRRLGISQSTCYRILQTLESADWIRPEQNGYVFSRGLLPFLEPLMGLERAVEALRADLQSLSRTTGLSVKLSQRQGVEQVTVGRAESPRPIAPTSSVGARFPVVLGASGACLLSFLEDDAVDRILRDADERSLWEHDSVDELRRRIAACRAEGICENIGSHPQGIDTMSSPLETAAGPLALTLVGLRGDFDGENRDRCRRLLLDIAQRKQPLMEHAS